MPRFWTPQAEVAHIEEGIHRDLFEPYGTTVQWWEFDPVNTTKDPVYDEPVARQWLAPKTVNVFSLIRDEGTEVPSTEGLYDVDTLHFSVLIKHLREQRISKPDDAHAHLRDRIVWDQYVWEIRRYQIAGRVQAMETVVGIDATRVMPEEMVNDPQFLAYVV